MDRREEIIRVLVELGESENDLSKLSLEELEEYYRMQWRLSDEM